jgi:hypothetical protein
MNQDLLNDIINIFENRINNEIMIRLEQIFDSILDLYPNIFRIKTRKDTNEISCYFSFIQISKDRPVVFAGTLERNLEGKIVPAIRFCDENISLRDIPARFKFPYRKPYWTYVEVNKETIVYFQNLVETQVRNHLGPATIIMQHSNIRSAHSAEVAEYCFKLCELQRGILNTRRAIEWKICVSFWSAIILGTGFLIHKIQLTNFSYWYFLLLLFVFNLWLGRIFYSGEIDHYWINVYKNRIDNHLGLDDIIPFHKPKCYICLRSVWWWSQFAITALFLFASGYLLTTLPVINQLGTQTAR